MASVSKPLFSIRYPVHWGERERERALLWQGEARHKDWWIGSLELGWDGKVGRHSCRWVLGEGATQEIGGLGHQAWCNEINGGKRVTKLQHAGEQGCEVTADMINNKI